MDRDTTEVAPVAVDDEVMEIAESLPRGVVDGLPCFRMTGEQERQLRVVAVRALGQA